MRKQRAYKLGLGSLAVGGLLMGLALMQGGLSADSFTLASNEGAAIIKAVLAVGAFFVAGGVACFIYATMAQK